jgi:hypothetical protein
LKPEKCPTTEFAVVSLFETGFSRFGTEVHGGGRAGSHSAIYHPVALEAHSKCSLSQTIGAYAVPSLSTRSKWAIGSAIESPVAQRKAGPIESGYSTKTATSAQPIQLRDRRFFGSSLMPSPQNRSGQTRTHAVARAPRTGSAVATSKRIRSARAGTLRDLHRGIAAAISQRAITTDQPIGCRANGVLMPSF